MTTHLVFNIVDTKKLTITKVYNVRSVHDNSLLGVIKWDTGWRQYVFHPESDCKFSNGCLGEIIMMIRSLMLERDQIKTHIFVG